MAVARCGNIYGGGDLNWSRVVPGTIRSLWHDERPIIRSDGKFTRDYVYVLDAVSAFLAMAEGLEKPEVRGEPFNFGPEKPLSVLEMVAAISKIMNKERLQPVILNEARGEIRDQYLSGGKAARMLGWRPGYTLEDGLRETVAWYTKFLEGAE